MYKFGVGSVLALLVISSCLAGCPAGTTVSVPNVVGMTQLNAATAIVAAGLSVGTISYASSDTVAVGFVISQSPTAGARVSSGSAVNLTVSTGPEVSELPSYTFTSNTTIPAGTYLAEQTVTVSDGVLTLSPGVTIMFAQGTRMSVANSGRLSAVGTASAPIVLTGQEEVRGYWGGLRFYASNSANNELVYVTIEYGGGYWDANLELSGTASNSVLVGLEHCTLRESMKHGLAMNEYAALAYCSSNTLAQNALGAASVMSQSAGYLDDGSTYTGNDTGYDIVEVRGGTVNTAASWPGIDAAYRVSGTITVVAALTLAPGARLEFENSTRMDVQPAGSLWAVGTALDPIVLTGEEETSGYWGGLRFYGTNSPNNRLENVFVEYGASYWEANVELRGTPSQSVQIAIVDCTLQGSSKYGLYCNQHSNVTSFSGNMLTGNAEGAAYINAEAVRFLDDTSTYVGNDYDVVEVPGGTVATAATWPAIDGAYLMTGTVSVQAPLTVDAGAILMFAAGVRLDALSGGTLTAVGTSGSPILFTGETQTAGYWGGIRLYQSNSSANQFDYCTIEYGGGYWGANLYLVGTSSVATQATITNCHISDSSGWGIELNNYATVNADVATANTFANNTSGNVYTP